MRKGASPDLETTLWQRLRADDRLEVSDLMLSLIGGTVYLSGSVPTVACKRLAEQIVRSVPRVRRVVNTVHITPAGYRSDEEVKRAVEAAVAQDPRLAGARISIAVADGIVTLMGEVDHGALRVAAERAAWSVWGVQAVINRTTVSGPSPLRDERLAAQLQQALEVYLNLDPKRVTVTVHGDHVVLSGHVPSAEHRLAAEDILRWYNRALSIENRLTVA